jgi:hypothetical protein
MLTLSKGANPALVVLGVVVARVALRLPLLIGLVAALPGIAHPDAERIATSENSPWVGFRIYGAAVRMLQEHPILGLGLWIRLPFRSTRRSRIHTTSG